MTSRRQFLTGTAAISVAACVPALVETLVETAPKWTESPRQSQCGFGPAPIRAEGSTVAYDILEPNYGGIDVQVISTGPLHPKGKNLHIRLLDGRSPLWQVGETITEQEIEEGSSKARGYVHWDLENHCMQRLHRVPLIDWHGSSHPNECAG